VIKLYTGVIINTLFVILGGLIGLFLKNYIKEKYTKTIMDSIGVFVLILGISYALESNNLIYVLISVILGGLIGEFLKIGDLLDKLRNKFQKDPNSSISPIDGIITCSILFCIGSMTIVGCLDSAINNDHSILYTKAIMDFIAIISLTTIYGKSTILTSVVVFVYQGLLVFLFSIFKDFFNPALITEINAVGGFLLVLLALNVLNLKHFKVINFLPSFIIIIILTLLFII
jgi:uncharacterized membrane protein YqgA involved in biofilm formation